MTLATDRPTTASPWLFFTVTFAITWSFWLPAAALDVSFNTPVGVAVLLAGLSGPGVAGVGLTYLVYDETGWREFWARLVDFDRVGVGWLLVVLLLPLGLNAVAALVDVVGGGTGATWGPAVGGFVANPLSLLPAVFFVTLPPFVEELGWRGYALDCLQLRRSALGASLVLGTVWAVWHLPLFFVADTYQAGLGVGTPEFWLFFVAIVPLSVALTWAYNNTDRSILVAILLHASVNFAGELVHITRRADVVLVGLWLLLAAGITVRWGADTLAADDEVPAPPRPECG